MLLIGIEAEVLVVESFQELRRRGSEAKGKIVVYNQPFVSYEETVAYRADGASEAAKVGAVASLIRSITPFSINRYLCKRLFQGLSTDPVGTFSLQMLCTLGGPNGQPQMDGSE